MQGQEGEERTVEMSEGSPSPTSSLSTATSLIVTLANCNRLSLNILVTTFNMFGGFARAGIIIEEESGNFETC